MDYIEIEFTVDPQPASEILVAYLSGIGFDTFEETSGGVKAYIPLELYNEQSLQELVEEQGGIGSISWHKELVKGKNWNEVWESSFEPVVVGSCCIRASFHEAPPGTAIDLIIEPKMSFGTGHHETTSLMVEQMLSMDLAGATVLDMGSGTGILSVLASKLGAKEITAIDIDEWAFTNCTENMAKNGVSNVRPVQGDAETLTLEKKIYNVILANINRNIILRDFARYDSVLERGGLILTSGFLDLDSEQIIKAAASYNYRLSEQRTKNHWTLLAFTKP